MNMHTHRLCPCCGQPTVAGKAPIESLKDAPLSAVARTIVNALVDAYPRAVSPEYLLERIYSGSHEPDNARTGLSVQITRLRTKLPSYGWTIPHSPTGRGNHGLYKLEMLP